MFHIKCVSYFALNSCDHLVLSTTAHKFSLSFWLHEPIKIIDLPQVKWNTYKNRKAYFFSFLYVTKETQHGKQKQKINTPGI